MGHEWMHQGKFLIQEGFPFHPLLSQWLRTWGVPEEASVEVLEISCQEQACPVAETLLRWENQELRISKPKEKIQKIDFSLAVSKQFSSVPDRLGR